MTAAFIDSNILVYVFGEGAKQARALELLRQGGTISVQSLNEVANVLRRKLKFDWAETRQAVAYIRFYCAPPIPLDDRLHRDGLQLAERYRLSVYDGMIVAAALIASCETPYSEDMHAGLLIDGRVRIVNPFAPV